MIPDDILDLIERQRDGALGPTEEDELRRRLAADPALLRSVVDDLRFARAVASAWMAPSDADFAGRVRRLCATTSTSQRMRLVCQVRARLAGPDRRSPGPRRAAWPRGAAWLAAAAILVVGLAVGGLIVARGAGPVALIEGDPALLAITDVHGVARPGARDLHAGDMAEALALPADPRSGSIAGTGLGEDEPTARATGAVQVGIRYGDGSLVTFAPGARVCLPTREEARASASAWRHSLLTGTITVDVTPQPAGHAFTMRSPIATLTVIGTRFTASAGDGHLRLAVASGRVRLQRISTGDAVEVGAGEQVFARPAGALRVAPLADATRVPWGSSFDGEDGAQRRLVHRGRLVPAPPDNGSGWCLRGDFPPESAPLGPGERIQEITIVGGRHGSDDLLIDDIRIHGAGAPDPAPVPPPSSSSPISNPRSF